MRVGVGRVKGHGLAEVRRRFSGKTLAQQFPAAGHVEASVGAGIAGRQPQLVTRLNLRGDLAEGIFVVAALDAFRRKFRWRRASCEFRIARGDQRLQQTLRGSVTGTGGQHLSHFACGSRGIAVAEQRHRQIKPIVPVIGIEIACLLERLQGGALPAPGTRYAEIVVDLGQRHARGELGKRLFRLLVLIQIERAQPGKELRQPGRGIIGQHFGQRGGGRLVLFCFKICFAQGQLRFVVGRVQPQSFTKVFDLVGRGNRHHAARVVFQRIQANRRSGCDESIAAGDQRGIAKAQ